MSNFRIGIEVIIIEDCRPEHKATGAHGTYEGDHPRNALIRYNGRDYEMDYEEFIKGGINELCDEYKGQRPVPQNYWIVVKNPRIRLQDNSVIWGDECWWQPVTKDMPPLEQLQKNLKINLAASLAFFDERRQQ